MGGGTHLCAHLQHRFEVIGHGGEFGLWGEGEHRVILGAKKGYLGAGGGQPWGTRGPFGGGAQRGHFWGGKGEIGGKYGVKRGHLGHQGAILG